MIIRIDYPESDVQLDLWGGTSGTFSGLDRFNRVIDQRWQNAVSSTPADIDRYQYGYDRDSNRTWEKNTVGTNFDEFYTYDDLNRLTQMQRGTLNGTFTGITGTPAKEQDWTLDPLGNWEAFLTKTSGTIDLNQTREHDRDNQITAILGAPAWSTPPSYDAAGNMTSFPQSTTPSSALTALYDAWNRMVGVSDTGGTVATYQYDGRNRRIVKITTAISETRHFYWTNTWQDVEERVGTSTSADLQYVWGIRYIDELVCRDASSTRLYAMQDANFSLTSICNTSGTVVERYVFQPYGTRAIYDASWSTRSSSSYAWVIGHQGLMHDEESGLIYNRARYTQPVLGRSMSREPFGGLYIDGMNLYQMYDSNPIDNVDSSGQNACRTGQGGVWDTCCTEWTPGWQIQGYTGANGKLNCFIANYKNLLPAGIPALGKTTLFGVWNFILARAGGGWRGGLYSLVGGAAVGATSQVYAIIAGYDLCNDNWCTKTRHADTVSTFWGGCKCTCVNLHGGEDPLHNIGDRTSP